MLMTEFIKSFYEWVLYNTEMELKNGDKKSEKEKKKLEKEEKKWKNAEINYEKAMAYNKQLTNLILKVCMHKNINFICTQYIIKYSGT